MAAKDDAIRELLGRVPSRRFNEDSVLRRLTEKFPGLMHGIASHLTQRIDEAGGADCPSGRRLAIQIESELLALRGALLSRVLSEGLTDDDGNEHRNLKTVLRLGDQLRAWVGLIGVEAPQRPNTAINIRELWQKAITGDETGDEGQDIGTSESQDIGTPGQEDESHD